jgi:hypothetical protein
MFTKRNVLTNPLDPRLAEKLISLFMHKPNIFSEIVPMPELKTEKLLPTNLSEEKMVWTISPKKKCNITFYLVTQEVSVENPTELGCPYLFYQYVKEISFSSTDGKLVREIQKKFEYFLKKSKEIPKRFVSHIYFDF